MRLNARNIVLAGVSVAVSLLAGCGIGGKTTTLSLQTQVATIPANAQQVFTAFISHNNGQFLGANWTLTSGGQDCRPACGTLNNPTNVGSPGNGDTATITYTAPSSYANSVTITAASVENPNSTGSDTFTVTAPAAISVNLSTAPPASLNTGATAVIAATVTNDSANRGVNWSCAPASACGSFNPTQTASGATTTYTAPANAPQGGSVTITATSVSDSTKSASASVAVTSSTPISVTLSTAPPASLNTSATAVIAATVANDSASKGVNWSCAPASACGSFNPPQTASGANTTYTAPSSVPAGVSVTITASSVSDNTKNASAVVNITSPTAISVTLSTAPPASLSTSATAVIAATVTNDSANKGVSWNCGPTGACGTFNPVQTASGASTTYTAPANVPSTQQAFITATSVADNTKSASANVAIATPGTLSVVISTFPLSRSLATGATAVYGATVSNDIANAGVTWSCSVSTGDPCGTFSPTQTASGATTTYTAPSSVPQSNIVNITATSVTDTTKSWTKYLTIYSPGTQNGLLTGQYAFLVTGQLTGQNFPWAGSITLDGNGNITAGEIDQPGGSGPASNFHTPVTGTYAIGAGGRGTITLDFSLQGVPSQFINFSLAATSNSHAIISQTAVSNSASGSLDLQTAGPNFSAAQVSGGYSFTLAGEDMTTFKPSAFGGILTADGAGNLSSGTVDTNDGGTITSAPFQGTFTAPDANGRGTITTGSGASFVYYLVTPKVLRLVETDAKFLASGTAYTQGSGSPSNSSLSGNFVFSLLGQDAAGASAAVGQFQSNGSGGITAGIADVVATGSVTSPSLANSTYAFSNSPRGTFTVHNGSKTFNLYLTDPTLNLLDPSSSTGGGGALILETDTGTYAVGQVIPQVNPTSATFQGNYALNATALQNSVGGASASFELDLAGQVTASGSNGFSGLADYAGAGFGLPSGPSFSAPPVAGSSVAGTFNADSVNPGRFTGRINITSPANSTYFKGLSGTNALLGVSYYQASSTQLFFIQTDGGEVAIGVLEQ